jgi:hypothetical protein
LEREEAELRKCYATLPKYPNPAKNVGQASGDIWGGRVDEREVTA